jgi:hypothetical protein
VLPDLVAQVHRPFALDGLDTPEIHLAGREQSHAATEEHRRDVQADLIDESSRQSLLRDADSAGQQHVLPSAIARAFSTAAPMPSVTKE